MNILPGITVKSVVMDIKIHKRTTKLMAVLKKKKKKNMYQFAVQFKFLIVNILISTATCKVSTLVSLTLLNYKHQCWLVKHIKTILHFMYQQTKGHLQVY